MNTKVTRILKWTVAAVVIVVIGFFAFSTEVREGEGAIILRFGSPRKVVTEAGLYPKLPWPFESVVSYEGRQQYLESDFLETTTKDKRNIILQSYAVWQVSDPLLYYNSLGDGERAEAYIKDQIFSATNGTLGAYDLSALVSLEEKEIDVDGICDNIYKQVAANCKENYGVEILDLSILRISLPDTNLQSVFDQMKAERQKEIDSIIANAEMEANKIKTDAETEGARIVADGETKAAEIRANTEKEVAEIYATAQAANVELYKFLLELDTMVESVDSDSVLVVTADSYPFNLLLSYSQMENLGTSDEVIVDDLNYILTQMEDKDRDAMISTIYTLLQTKAVK